MQSRRLLAIIGVLLALLCVAGVAAGQMTDTPGSEDTVSIPADAHHQVTAFYSSHCSACSGVMPTVRDIAAAHPGVRFVFYDTAPGGDVYRVYSAFDKAYGSSNPSVPVVFAGDTVVLTGEEEIQENLEEVVVALEYGLIPSADYEERWRDGRDGPAALTLPLVLTAGLLDGINPCAFAVLVFLLIGVLGAGTRGRVFAAGIAYSLAVFSVYFLSGLGLFAAVRSLEVMALFSIAAGCIAIVAGVLQVASAFVHGLPVTLAIPERAKKRLAPLLREASVPAACLLGALAGIFELPCTGGVYLAVLALLSEHATVAEGIPYLLAYNVMFVLPLLAITAGIGLGIPPERVDTWRLGHRRALRFALGVFLIGLGVVTLAI